MKKILFFLMICCSLMVSGLVSADDVDYSIRLYKGELTVNKDNSASFQQNIVYDFDSGYRGQYVTLGTAGKVPKGFQINSHPDVAAYKMDKKGRLHKRSIRTEIEKLSDGYRVKVYNGGNKGDRIVLSLNWRLKKITTVYSDIAELNWVPISDWDAALGKVILTVKGPEAVLKGSRLYAHTGYFKVQPKVSRKNNLYKITLDHLGQGKQLELHAYWPSSDFSLETANSDKRLAQFQAVERDIARNQKFYPFLVGKLLPLVAAALLLLAGLCYLIWKGMLGQKKVSKHMHLFSPPADFSPLLLARYVYNLEVGELSPLKGRVRHYDIGFKELIQASLLDLIDQGKLKISANRRSFAVPDKNRLEPYEEAFLTFVYGEGKMPIDNAFADYKISQGIFEGSDQAKIRQRGQNVLDLFEKRVKNLDSCVKQAVDSLGFENINRQRTRKENSVLAIVYWLTVLALLLSLAVSIFSLFKGYWFGLGTNAVILVLSVVLLIFYYLKDDYYKVSGLLTQEGLAVRQGWDAFKNMIRDVKTFDDVDLEGVVVWNRILVYATLYGYADRVQDYLKLNDIKLDNPQINNYLAVKPAYYIGLSAGNLSSYTSTAAKASNFSVSSGGSIGGGFSGGGGGGGGGAF
ncbi:DUF2207 family protein [Streptococcus caviae]|uniref:DUF2207 family protein n=1 Tax=Streptococcus sp. 'caviae' TaxID=1915004 RepID=UPI00094B93DE|nr:DUF2207 domain-containing protein [Streptococcus sp. 'caviae']OLN82454.1 hypothetical protein BMI76_09060 [Streptococcus sp. 'caviae']